MRIAVDVMGGDHAPDEILKGCIAALADLPQDDTLVLVGPKDLIADVLADRGINDKRVEIYHAPDVIAMDDPPALAVRGKPESSIVKLMRLGSEKSMEVLGVPRCEVVLSAGNTGACVSAAIMHMKRLSGVHRPGIAVTIPTFHSPAIMIDCGANPEPKASHLWQYAVMAEQQAKILLGIPHPRVAQMNIGSEEAKGTGIIKQTRDLLKATPGLNYIGYIEGRELFENAADIVVTDGFVGNTLLKMAEGLYKSIFKALAAEIIEYDPNLMTSLDPVIRKMVKKHDYHEHGGAPLLGVNGACFIAHGSSEARTIRAAIRNCRSFVAAGVNEAIVRRLEEVAPMAAEMAE
ncbi:MAG: phosphate acyltransferase PlsX [Planctomycetota bacterium]|jgi:glycerol-3-phosphate acyltransferase PlsX|nr:phosphate acyltransferase PlsX [Planctomycetota bacterium]